MDRTVVGVGTSAAAGAALCGAADEARLHGSAPVVLHACFRPLADGGGNDEELAGLQPQLHPQAQSVLDEALRAAKPSLGGSDVHGELRPGNAAGQLLDLAASADPLVVEMRGADIEAIGVSLPFREHGPVSGEVKDVAPPGWRQRLPRAATPDDLLVGSRGLGGLSGLLGSVSRRLLHHAPCPVVVLR